MNPSTWGKKKSTEKTESVPSTLKKEDNLINKAKKKPPVDTGTEGRGVPPEGYEPKDLGGVPEEEKTEEFKQRVKEIEDAQMAECLASADPISAFERREFRKKAEEGARSGLNIAKEKVAKEQIVWEEGVPAKRVVTGWYVDPTTKKKVWGPQEFTISPAEQRVMAEQFRTARAGEHLTQAQIKQAQEASEALAPEMLEFQKGELRGAIQSQAGQRREQMYAESLMPMQHQFTKGQMEIALDELKKEKFSRTKKGKTLRILGQGFDSGLQAVGTGIAGAGAGAAYFTRAGGGPGTASITGVYAPQRVNTWTPAGSLHANTMNPAGRAMMPNLVNLNPAISVNRMSSVNPNLSPLSKNPNLSPLPRRRQVQPGVSKIQ